MKNFWRELDKPFFCLAPMYDVTDEAFRAMVVRHSKMGAKSDLATRDTTSHSLVLFTEFVSADGLASEAGRAKLLRELYYTKAERPIVAQIFGSQPDNIEKAVELIRELDFDGVDINLGCPDRAVEKQGAGSALMKNPELAKEIIKVAKRGAKRMPVSVKTRLGYNQIDENWWQAILEAKPDAVTFHLRTRKEMSDTPAHYEVLPKIVERFKNSGIVLIANGDIKTIEQGKDLTQKYGLDGVMIGRGAFGRPDLFASLVRKTTSGSLEVAFLTIEAERSRISRSQIRLREAEIGNRLKLALEHVQLFWDLYGPTLRNKKLFNGHQKNFAVMRKHFKAYVVGFRGATKLRAELMTTQNPSEVETIVKKFLKTI